MHFNFFHRQVARFGAILATLAELMAQIWTPAPMVLMGSVSILAGGLAILLPETAGNRFYCSTFIVPMHYFWSLIFRM